MKNTSVDQLGQDKVYRSPLYRAAAHIPARFAARLTLAIILSCANTTRPNDSDYMQSHVAQATIAARLKRTTMTARRAIAELKELGVIKVRQRGLRYTNVTTIDPVRLFELEKEAAEFCKSIAADRTKMIGLDDTPMSGQDRSKMLHDLGSSDLGLNDLSLTEYASAAPEEPPVDQGFEELVIEGEPEPILTPITDEPQSHEGLPDLVVHYGDVIEAAAYEEIVAAHEREEVPDAPAQAALKGVQRHRYSLGAVALALALSTGILDENIVASVREWVRKCVCVHTTTDQKHYVRILVAFLDGKAGRIGKMNGRLADA